MTKSKPRKNVQWALKLIESYLPFKCVDAWCECSAEMVYIIDKIRKKLKPRKVRT